MNDAVAFVDVVFCKTPFGTYPILSASPRLAYLLELDSIYDFSDAWDYINEYKGLALGFHVWSGTLKETYHPATMETPEEHDWEIGAGNISELHPSAYIDMDRWMRKTAEALAPVRGEDG